MPHDSQGKVLHAKGWQPSQIQFHLQKHSDCTCLHRGFQNFTRGSHPRIPFTGGIPPQTAPLSPLHGSTLALRASAQSLQYLDRPLSILEKSQGISFGLESVTLLIQIFLRQTSYFVPPASVPSQAHAWPQLDQLVVRSLPSGCCAWPLTTGFVTDTYLYYFC